MANKERIQNRGNWAERVSIPNGGLEREFDLSERYHSNFEVKEDLYEEIEGGELAYANWN